MTSFTMTHDLDCDVERFWALYFDRDFSTKLFRSLEFPRWEIVDERTVGDEVVRVVEATPKLDVPAAIAKVLGPGFGYREESRFNRTTKVLVFTVKPNALEGKLRNEGTVRCEPAGEGRCRRVVEVVAEAKVFGVGGALEKMTEKSYRDGWGKSAAFINRWVKEHP